MCVRQTHNIRILYHCTFAHNYTDSRCVAHVHSKCAIFNTQTCYAKLLGDCSGTATSIQHGRAAPYIIGGQIAACVLLSSGLHQREPAASVFALMCRRRRRPKTHALPFRLYNINFQLSAQYIVRTRTPPRSPCQPAAAAPGGVCAERAAAATALAAARRRRNCAGTHTHTHRDNTANTRAAIGLHKCTAHRRPL